MISKETPKLKKRNEVNIPEGVSLKIERNVVTVNGPKGEASKALADPRLSFEVKDGRFLVRQDKFSRKEKKVVNTFLAHVRNLIKGAVEGYVYKLKVCATHFPISVSVEGDKVIIKNFLGEKIPRKAKIYPGVSVKVDKDVITVEGASKESVSQTAANIEQICRITSRDRRIFQDGCWITQKAGRDM